MNLKDLLGFNMDCLKTSFSVKKIVDTTRVALRKELANVHDALEVEEDSGVNVYQESNPNQEKENNTQENINFN